MADQKGVTIDFKLMEELLLKIRNKQNLKRAEIREGFASMRKHYSQLAI